MHTPFPLSSLAPSVCTSQFCNALDDTVLLHVLKFLLYLRKKRKRNSSYSGDVTGYSVVPQPDLAGVALYPLSNFAESKVS